MDCRSLTQRLEPTVHEASLPMVTAEQAVRLVQEVKTGKHEVVREVEEVTSERDSLKAEVSSLTQKVSYVEAQLVQAKDSKAAQQASPSASKQVKVCTTVVLMHNSSPNNNLQVF